MQIFDKAHLFSTECVDRDDKSKCDVMKSKGECVHEKTKWLAEKMCRKTCGYCGKFFLEIRKRAEQSKPKQTRPDVI